MEKYICTICGYNGLTEPPRDENGRPSFETCNCCGTAFGYDDKSDEHVISFRNNWIEQGGTWFSEQSKPENWNMEEQLKNIGSTPF